MILLLLFVVVIFPPFFKYNNNSNMSENTFRILVATDNHLGYKYHPPTRY